MIEEKYNKILEFFKTISKIPRNSKEEEKFAEFLCTFASTRNLYYRKDKFNNVLIKKKASKGYENKKTILFQAHTDMVCEKKENSNHDFKKDKIEIIEEENTLHAKNTTLGADDGIGVAFLMLLLDDEKIKHPNIECLFTTEEEIGMNGARCFDYSDINASFLINLDGEEENTAIVGCVGGITIEYSKKLKRYPINNEVYELSISNLYGGHSGVDIDKGRINSNLLAASILKDIDDIQIISFIGGNKDNAIANSTKVLFTTNVLVNNLIKEKLSNLKITKEDSNMKVSCEKVENNNYKAISNEESKNILTLINNLKQNVIEYSKDVKDLVETSGNIGVVKIDKDKCIIKESLRSSDDNKRKLYQEKNNTLAHNLEFSTEEYGEYPGWKYNPNSKLQEVYINSYKKYHDDNPNICAIHAGVECGMIYEKLPHLDMISLGPDIKDVHTPKETLYLDSCKRLLQTLIDMIDNLD